MTGWPLNCRDLAEVRGVPMTTPAEQRQRAARLFLMASAAYGRCEPKLAEQLIKKSNECADQAAGLRSAGDQTPVISEKRS